ncbi:YbaB/EbfC family nucleoid-associated protein, partial [Corallococcus sp. AB049A]
MKNIGNIGQLMAKAGEMRQKMEAMQAEMGKRQVTGDAGAGMVTATVNGRLELIKLKIDRERLAVANAEGKTALSQGDFEMLEDLIAAAVRSAQVRAAEMMKDEMSKMAGDMGLPPG